MRKTVRIDDIVCLAKSSRERAERYEREGKVELATRERIRIDGMMSAISMSLDYKNFEKEWSEIYDLIHNS